MSHLFSPTTLMEIFLDNVNVSTGNISDDESGSEESSDDSFEIDDDNYNHNGNWISTFGRRTNGHISEDSYEDTSGNAASSDDSFNIVNDSRVSDSISSIGSARNGDTSSSSENLDEPKRSSGQISVKTVAQINGSKDADIHSEEELQSSGDEDNNLDESAIVSTHRKPKQIMIDSDTASETDEENEADNKLEESAIMSTHRKSKQILIDSDTSSETDEDNENDIVDVSSGEDNPPLNPITPRKQLTLPQMMKQKVENAMLNNNTNVTDGSLEVGEPGVTKVSRDRFEHQQQEVKNLQANLNKMQGLLKTLNVAALPDKGVLLHGNVAKLKAAIITAENQLKKMVIDDDLTPTGELRNPIAWDNLKAMAEGVQPKTFGQQAMATLNTQKTLTLERLQQLHSSLTTRPTEDTFAEEPKDLRVELMPHQKHALAWLLWRENQKPSGGILADDMGLGKTLTMISLMLASRQSSEEESDGENQPSRKDFKHEGGTLVVCPASLLNQWESEVEKHCKRYSVNVEIYHGAKRETNAKRLAKHDMVVTTYTICSKENEKRSALYGVRWRRIILDEAHQIRNHKSQTSIAVCELRAKSRWALTGTPIHNKELDMYALLKFLRCSPFDDLAVWKRWIANKNAGGQDRIHTIISSIMLRRTKAILQETGAMQPLPERSSDIIEVKLQGEEQAIHEKILTFSKTLFTQYLHQHANKQNGGFAVGDPNSAYYKLQQKYLNMKGGKEIKQHEILVLLLRLRQICCHPSLITKMLHGDQLLADEDIVGTEEFDLLSEMKRLNLDEDSSDTSKEETDGFQGSIRELLNPNNPIFSEDTKSTKVRAVLKLLREKIIPSGDKVIIVSQWTGFLRLFMIHLEAADIPYEELNGTVPVHKRMTIVQDFNNPKHRTKVLLLSLTAGGVGLNLVGANHMILLDLHWNPQLEMQAQDRIYRVGQTKTVHVYKIMTINTIEERIKALQERKLAIADSMLTGSKVQHTKLSLQDLKMLFGM